MTRYRILSFTILSLFLCEAAFAQATPDYNRGEVFGKVGFSDVFSTATLGPTSVVDTEAMVAGGVELRPIRQLGFEFEASRMHQNESGFGVTPTNGSVAFLDFNAVYHFIEGRFQPYAFGGGGWMILKEELAPPIGTRVGRVFTVGAGMDIGLTPHWFVRTEGRAYSPRIFDKILTLSAGLAYHF
jgi:opacity protein-like surface antigen